MGNFRLYRQLLYGFCVLFALLCTFSWFFGASRFSNSKFPGYVAGSMCDLCSFKNVCMFFWRVTVLMWCLSFFWEVSLDVRRIKQFLEKKQTPFCRVYRRYLQVNHIASGIKICWSIDRLFGGSLVRTPGRACEAGLYAAPCLVCRFPRVTRVTRAMRTTKVSLAKNTM